MRIELGEVNVESYEHSRIRQQILSLDVLPEDSTEYCQWIRAQDHLGLLRENALSSEVIVLASGKYTYVHSVAVPRDALSTNNAIDLLGWSGSPLGGRAWYMSYPQRGTVGIERDEFSNPLSMLDKIQPLVFYRHITGLRDEGAYYSEVLQEYLHLSDAHWRQEFSAYCNFDLNGDWQAIVSITEKGRAFDVALVTFQREDLEDYLRASNSVLVQTFEFMLIDFSQFRGWPRESYKITEETENFAYKQTIDPNKAIWTNGIQILYPGQSSHIPARNEYCRFIAYDWRNKRIATISTDPVATTSYFDAADNSLPFDTTPAFFRSEVLSKYKADNEKYTISEENRYIDCRGGWGLRAYDINEAGQVHAYLCYLRELPYQEQLHWLSFNEAPKANISQRAFLNDFEAEFSDDTPILTDVLYLLRNWDRSRYDWWSLRDLRLLDGVNTPVTNSKDEWAQAFTNLAKLVIEGFQENILHLRLDAMGVPYKRQDRSLALLEKILSSQDTEVERLHLDGLRLVQRIRTLVSAHYGGSKADNLAREALTRHGTYGAHFKAICAIVIEELKIIEEVLGSGNVT